MIIDLKQLEQDEIHVVYEYPDSFQLGDANLSLQRAPAVDFTLRRMGAEIRTTGGLKAGLLARCDRCLTNYSLPISSHFDLFFASVNSVTNGGEVELGLNDLTCAFYRDAQIDVDGLVREQIQLALPFRLLCREDCRGLCLTCGADLNHESCLCRSEPVDARWSDLRGLLSGDES